jgi:hypothetical protein
MPVTVRESPSGSLSLARTAISTGVFTSVVAVSFVASGDLFAGGGGGDAPPPPPPPPPQPASKTVTQQERKNPDIIFIMTSMQVTGMKLPDASIKTVKLLN